MMPIARPLQTRDYFFLPGDEHKTRLTMALWIRDEVAEKPPLAQLAVNIVGREKAKAIRNLSGYYCFVDLPRTIYTVRVEGEGFVPFEEPIDVTALPPKSPVIDVFLQPDPAYAFPAHATLIRGAVQTPRQTLAANAEVKAKAAFIPPNTLQTRTNANGEFVVYLKKVELEKAPPPLKGERIKDVTLQIVHEGKSKSVSVYGVLPDLAFTEGMTANLKTITLT